MACNHHPLKHFERSDGTWRCNEPRCPCDGDGSLCTFAPEVNGKVNP